MLEADIAILALGGMDALGEVAPASVAQRAERAVSTYRDSGATVILVSVDVSLVSRPAYAAAFREVFESVARRYGVRLVPDILEGVPRIPAMFQLDGIHPTGAAQSTMLSNVWPFVREAARSRGCAP